jgi:hypothetical protein
MAKLNVILHGLAAVLRRHEELVVLLPDLDGQHVFRAGTWLAETELRPGTYVLGGVKRGAAVFDPEKNLILGKGRLVANPPVHARLHLPIPAEIYSLKPVEMNPREDFEGASRPAGTKLNLATVQVLSYEIENLQALRLFPHLWEPPADADLEVTNLHIYSEEDHSKAPQGHAKFALDRAAALFAGVDLRLVNEKDVPPLGEDEVLPPATSRFEAEDLAQRMTRLKQQGEMLRVDSDIRHAWRNPGRPLSVRVSACSFPILEED